eukprot:TRINITY_DN1877_c0_g2_i1.p1 TRINITY_DN1877_c0_g2~~TRINITY_DN1877_c0_g2_i1.p1  ORF type:complete len:311 (-),score=-21.64 TRINITY_DN1877_c0_g2_i1:138-1043(-)
MSEIQSTRSIEQWQKLKQNKNKNNNNKQFCNKLMTNIVVNVTFIINNQQSTRTYYGKYTLQITIYQMNFCIMALGKALLITLAPSEESQKKNQITKKMYNKQKKEIIQKHNNSEIQRYNSQFCYLYFDAQIILLLLLLCFQFIPQKVYIISMLHDPQKADYYNLIPVKSLNHPKNGMLKMPILSENFQGYEMFQNLISYDIIYALKYEQFNLNLSQKQLKYRFSYDLQKFHNSILFLKNLHHLLKIQHFQMRLYQLSNSFPHFIAETAIQKMLALCTLNFAPGNYGCNHCYQIAKIANNEK